MNQNGITAMCRNMRIIILWSILLLFTNTARSQSDDPVTFLDIIKTLVADSGSVFFYPKLLHKVQEHPGDLTDNDVQYLYYGQVFKIGYTPRPLFSDDRDILEQYMSNGRKKKVIEFGTEILKKHPVDLTALLYTSKCMKDKRLPDTTFFFGKRYRMLLAAILNSGNGKSIESPIIVTEMWDEFIIKGVLGYLGGTDGIAPSNNNFGAICIWDTPRGKIFFEEIYYTDNHSPR